MNPQALRIMCSAGSVPEAAWAAWAPQGPHPPWSLPPIPRLFSGVNARRPAGTLF